MQSLLIIWISAALFFVLMEVHICTLVWCLPCAVGAAVGAIACWGEMSIFWQCAFAAISAIIAVYIIAQLVVRANAHKTRSTNVDALIGMHGRVTQPIMPYSTGQVKINGEIWSAREAHNSALAVGAHITIVAVRGAHLIVITT